MNAAQDAAKESTSPSSDSQHERITVVGIGASAGGLKPLQTFFKGITADSDLAFVVVTHMAPDQESLLPELLQRYTHMPVRQVQSLLPVEPNHVYVIPPGRRIVMTDTHINPEPFDEPPGHRTPVDDYFRSLAAAHRSAVAVILSGGGTDGAVGVKAIKEHNGLLLVQQPTEAEYDGMPSAAIATGLADLVLPADELAQKLLAYRQSRLPFSLDPDQLSENDLSTLQRILAQVEIQTSHDLSQYRYATLLQRIVRRMKLHSIEKLDEYLVFLRNNKGEAHTIFNDLLVGTTTFFRSQESWEALAKQVIPRLFAGKKKGDSIRVWSIGCATGEEAYSLAILLFEEAARQYPDQAVDKFPFPIGPRIQIFASDLEENALYRARQGRYPDVIEGDLGRERLARFFEKEGSYYRIRPELRDAVLFTRHSVLYDPPFSRLDLISNRNLLTHLQYPLRRSVMEIFFFALNTGGFLFLDKLDAAEVSPDLFKTLDQANHIYTTQIWPKKNFPLPEPRTSTNQSFQHPESAEALGETAAEVHHREALEAMAPPSLLVNENLQVLHLSESVGRYLQLPPGIIKTDLLQLVRTELQPELKNLLPLAFQDNKSVFSLPIPSQIKSTQRRVIIAVRPFKKGNRNSLHPFEETLALVFFLEDEAGLEGWESAVGTAPLVQSEEDVERLKTRLKDMVHKYEMKNEALWATNETLTSIIAEHNTTVEELETGREELYSLNEELHATNDELDQRVKELSAANSDLENLIAATNIPTLFLDRNLVVQRATPSAVRLFSLAKSDQNFPVSDLAAFLRYDQIIQDARRVIETLIPCEREVKTVPGRWLLIRHHPYLSAENRVAGIVLTFVDITKIKETVAELRRSEALIAEEVFALRRLHQMTGQVVTATDMQKAMDEILDASMDLLHADFGAVQLLDESRQKLYFAATKNFEQALLDKYKEVAVNNEWASGHVTRSGRQVLIENIDDEPPGPRYEAIAEWGFKALQATPLINHQGELIGVLSNQFRKPRKFSERDQQWLDLLAYQAANLVERLRAEERLEQRVKARTAQVRQLASELIAAEQTVRQRLAQSLHDNLQQTLYAGKVQLLFLREVVGDIEELEKLETLSNLSLNLTRRLTVELSPPILEREGLLEALKWLAAHMKEFFGLQVTVESKDHPRTSTEEQRILLYQIVRELLFNVVKHAGIMEASIWLEKNEDGLDIIVKDEGDGFDVEAALGESGAGFGLRSINERLRLFDGWTEVKSQPGHGTQVRLFLPT